VLPLILDNATLEAGEIWEAPFAAVVKRQAVPGSKSRERGALGVSEIKRMAHKVWPVEERPS
jgi:hypothetical protein